MKKKIITCAGVSFVIIFVLLSVNFLQSGTGSISKENIEKENEFKKSLDVVAQEEEPDEVSKEFANKLGVDEKNIVSTGNAIKAHIIVSQFYHGQKERSIRGMHFRKGKILQIIREQC
ncbi:MAG: hypothetical protein ACLUGO_09855 [Mediterraneibacter faecis]